MYTNRDGCTVWEQTVKDRNVAWERHESGRIYCEETFAMQSGGMTTSKDTPPKDGLFIVIPSGSLTYRPKPGDRIVAEVDAADAPPQEAKTVVTVKDFRYGSAAVQHMEVYAE